MHLAELMRFGARQAVLGPLTFVHLLNHIARAQARAFTAAADALLPIALRDGVAQATRLNLAVVDVTVDAADAWARNATAAQDTIETSVRRSWPR